MKNWLWIVFGVLVLAILLLLSKDDYEIPHSNLRVDTIDYKVGGGPETGGGDPEMGYTPATLKQQPSELFLGKKFAKCLEMVYEWPDSKVFEMNDSHDGIANMDFIVNNHHHQLYFDNDICVEDNILKK
ncbi:MAG: hypothetical protein KA981_00950 [Bacteroidia bacterium]|jgi:hypothetical protein|nr:hypothetical protein [Bacteroidia bacterium]